MTASVRGLLDQWRVGDALTRHDGLRLEPTADGTVVVSGVLRFHVQGPTHDPIDDAYQIRMRLPPAFPDDLPLAWETGGRIPQSFHRNPDGSLCLGADIEQRMVLQSAPTLPRFIDRFVIPYLFGRSFFEKHGTMPFDELSHGDEGIQEHIASLFHSSCNKNVVEFLRLAGLKKRIANKYPCPCGSGRRLGRCHHRRVNRLRGLMGGVWFRTEFERLCGSTNFQRR
jgi:hypothetical protein